MNEQTMRFRLAVFILGAAVGLGILLTLFGTYPNWLKQHSSYVVVFKKAAGVTPGTPIRRSGVRIGEVRRVDLDDQSGKVRVTIWVDKPHPVFESDRPVLVHGFLSGDTSIDFLPPLPDGHPAEPAIVPPDSEINGMAQTDVASLLNDTSRIVPQAQDALLEISKTLKRYEQAAPLVEETLRHYRDLAKSINDTMPEARKLIVSAQEIGPDVKLVVREIQDIGPEMRQLIKNVQEVIPEIRQFIRVAQELAVETKQVAKLAQEMAPEIKRTNQEIQVAVQNYARVAERVDALIRLNQDRVVESVERLNDVLERAATLLSPENQKLVHNTIKNFEAGTRNLDKLVENAGGLVDDSRTVARKLEKELQQIEDLLESLKKTTKPLSERSEVIVKNVEQASGELTKLVAELRETLQVVAGGDGTLRKFLNDPSIYNNLNEGICMFIRLIPKIERIMKDVEVFADKIARHPESLGVGGAVRPSAGIKEGPSSWTTPRNP